MSLISRMFRPPEKREAGFSEKLRKWVIDMGSSSAGVTVNEDSALKLSAVYGCVSIISSDIGTLPCLLYKEAEDGGRGREKKHHVYSLLKNRPNPWTTPAVFWQTVAAHVLLRGAAYCEIQRDVAGRAVALWPITQRCKPIKNPVGMDLIYEVDVPGGKPVYLASDNVLHFLGFTLDGVNGISPLTYAREVFGIGLATQEFAGRYFKNDASPNGTLEHPNQIGDKAYERLKKSISERHEGVSNAHRFMILEEGMKWQKIGLSADDSQMLENRDFGVEEVCRIFRVPPHMLASLKRSTNNNIEHQDREYVTRTLRPWLVKFEQELNRKLLAEDEMGVLYIEFLVEALLRGDSKTRSELYAAGRQWGYYTINDVRKLENMNPVAPAVGDTYLVPANMTVFDATGKVMVIGATNGAGPTAGTKEDPKKEPDPTKEDLAKGGDPVKKDAANAEENN